KILEHGKEHGLAAGRTVESFDTLLMEGDGGAAKDREGQDQNQGGGEYGHDGKFSQRAAAGNPSYEHAHEWCPRDPPRPVESSPVGLEFDGFIAQDKDLAIIGKSSLMYIKMPEGNRFNRSRVGPTTKTKTTKARVKEMLIFD